MKYAIQLTSLILISLIAFSLDISIGDEGVRSVEISMINEGYAACTNTKGPNGGIITNCTDDNQSAAETARLQRQNGANSASDSSWIKDVVDALNAILGFFTFIITPLIALAGWLLSPDWTRGDLFGLNIGLYKIWVTISNITYFLYALGLIGIALATIFNVENYTYKQLLPKLALGILIVPFTWWIVQAVLSVSNILTVAVMQIPRDTLQSISRPNANTTWWYSQKSIPKTVTYDGTSKDGNITTSAGVGGCLKNGKEDPEKSSQCISPETILTEASSGPYSMLTVYAYSVFKIQEYKAIDITAYGITYIMQIANKLIFGALIYLIFGLLIIALVFALLARAFELWILTMFSPLLSLSIVLPESMKGDAFKEHLSFSNLISLAMIPVYVSAALSFGILFLGLLMNGNGAKENLGADTTCGSGVNAICLFGSKGSFLEIKASKGSSSGGNSEKSTIESSFTLGDFKLIHKGTITNEEATDIGSATNFFSGSGGIIGTIILNIIGLTLLWLALMGALKASKITASAIEPFEKAGKSIGELGKSLPKYAPIPGTGISANSLSKVADKAKYLPAEADQKRLEESRLGRAFNIGSQVSKPDEIRVKELSPKIANGDIIALQEATAKMKQNVDKNIANSEMGQDYFEAVHKAYKGDVVAMQTKLKSAGWGEDVAKLMAQKLSQYGGKLELKGRDQELLALMKKDGGSASTTGANQQTTSIGGRDETTDEKKKEKNIHFEMIVNTESGKRIVTFNKDKDLVEPEKSIEVFKEYFKGKSKDKDGLESIIKSELGKKLSEKDLKLVIGKLKDDPSIGKTNSDNSTASTDK